MKKLKLPQLDYRLLYLAAAALVPGIPLFFLYNRNAAQGLLFRHFLITGGVLAVISIAIYLVVSKFILGYRRATVIIALFWAAFWFYNPMSKIIPGGNASTVFYLLLSIGLIGYFLGGIKISRLVANTIAILLCLMFAYNFIPGALAVSTYEIRGAYNKITDKLPYAVKTDFRIDRNLPKPNIYWLHMDGMVGFDTVERYFNDPQTTLKNDLIALGFVINKSARLEAGYTTIAMTAMTSPVFYDSYLASEFARVAKLTRPLRENAINLSMTNKGFSLNDIAPQTEILKALSEAGYINISNNFGRSKNLDIFFNNLDPENVITTDVSINLIANSEFNILIDFINIITDNSVLSVIKTKIYEILEKERPIISTQPIPVYHETVDNKYVKGLSDPNLMMAFYVRIIKYVLSIQSPHFLYFNIMTTHSMWVDPIGWIFNLDENGNRKWLENDDPLDVHLYLAQHKYAVKEMMTQIYFIIENDPYAVIIIQGDHGIHAYGRKHNFYDFKEMSARGYSLEDQLNLNLSVISAVRIPPQYGKLSQPLDPLDIARYLVNNFVGKGNYDYLYYTEE